MPRKGKPPKGTNPVGRPPDFKTAEELDIEVNKYFKTKEPKTITGLAYYLGFASRQSYYDYAAKGQFAYILKRAHLKIEKIHEGRLQGTTPTGSIFWLKNSSWSDRQEIVSEITGKLEVTANVTYRGIEVVKPEDDSTGEKV